MEFFEGITAVFQTLSEAIQTFIQTITSNIEAGTAIDVFYKEVILKLHEVFYGGWEETGFDKIVIGKVFDFFLNIFSK